MDTNKVMEPNKVIEDRKKTQTSAKKRCHFCNKKIGILGIECKCGFVFCNMHRFSETHNCTFDFKNHDKNLLKERLQNEICQFSKIDKI
jgi:predicted nucleic acid binding AN1-type Zn finger protein